MAPRRGIFSRIAQSVGRFVREIVGIEPPSEPRRRRSRRRPARPEPPAATHRKVGPPIPLGWATTESEYNDITWTVAGWVDTGGGQHNSSMDSPERDSDEPSDSDLEDADYAIVRIDIEGDIDFRPFVGVFPGGRDELDQKVIDWLTNGSPPGQWGAG